MHSKKDDAAKAGKSAPRTAIVPVTVPAGGATAYNPPTVNAKPALHELTTADKTGKKASGNVSSGHDEKEFKYNLLASQSQILRASHAGFSQISQSSTPISNTPRPLTAVPHPAVSAHGPWTLGDRSSADRPRKSEEEKLHKLCQLVPCLHASLFPVFFLLKS
jgi:hypothetical protein